MTVKGENRVIRGGAWNNDAENCRSAYRNRNDPGNRDHNVGFRLLSTRRNRILVMHGQRVWFTDHARVHKALSRSCSCAGLRPDE